jgi:predicted membrane protein
MSEKVQDSKRQRVVAEPGSIQELANIHQLELRLSFIYLGTLLASLTARIFEKTWQTETALNASVVGTVTILALTIAKKRKQNRRKQELKLQTPATTVQMPVEPSSSTR